MGSSFIHLIRTDSNVFFLMAKYYSIVYMYHSFLIHSSADGHLGCFHVLKIWNALRICVSSLRRGHANLLCIVPILVYVLLKGAQHKPLLSASLTPLFQNAVS